VHVTNGDAALPALRAAGVGEGEVLIWADPLHDGPVPGGLSYAELRAVREEFLGADFRERDARLDAALATDQPVVLWFEADLFDMLNVLQILDRVPGGADVRLVLVGQGAWRSVTEVPAEELAALGRAAPLVSDSQLDLARRAWAAFTSSTPLALESLVTGGTPELPAVGHTLQRLLEELPWVGDGLGRTERQLRTAFANGARTREEAFMAAAAQEERPFLGDASAWRILDREPGDSRWIGGTEIPPGQSPWLWCPEAQRIAVSASAEQR
jgi:hypothetical protein